MKCPSCGRDIPDDSEICPYCTASIKHRVRIKAIYVIALSLVILAASYGVLAYYGGEVPITKIKDLGLTDNYNFIRLHGKVEGYPWVYENDYQVTSFRFKLNDGTGTVTVKLYGNVIKRMVELHKIPAMGDTVDIKGTYMYSSNSLILNNIDYLEIESPKHKGLNISDIINAAPWDYKNGAKVFVSGNITSVREFSFGFICTIDEKLDVLIPRAYYSLHILNISKMGSAYTQFYGALQFYQPVAPSDTYKVVNLPDLLSHPEAYNGTYIRITWARVMDRDLLTNTITVYSNGSSIPVYVRNGVKYYTPGTYVEIQGKFVNYKGTWEISVSHKNDFVTEPKWELIADPTYKVLEKKEYVPNGPMKEFSLVEIKGSVVDYRMFSYSASLTIWGNNQSYVVYVENKAMMKNIDYGKPVVIRGIVTYYNGQPEIKVRPFTGDLVEVTG